MENTTFSLILPTFMFRSGSRLISREGRVEAQTSEYLKNTEFLEFVNREFNQIALYASVEELAEFAFGSIEEAIKAYKEQNDEN